MDYMSPVGNTAVQLHEPWKGYPCVIQMIDEMIID